MKRTEQRAGLYSGETAVALRIRPLEPLERLVRLPPLRIRLRSLVRHGFRVLLDQLSQRRVRLGPMIHGMMDDRQHPKAEPLVLHAHGVGERLFAAALTDQGQREMSTRTRPLRDELQ